MVYFTCNHCGDSLKKPTVEKHYNTKCRGAPVSVSCMDCLKDFYGEEFVAHTKCISEMQKYSGKDYKPRESENKGAKKQESWIDTLRSILDSSEYDLKPATRQALIKLQGFDNVPRKKAKFINFVTNSVHIPKGVVEDVWNILEKELERIKQANQKSSSNGLKEVKEEAKLGGFSNGVETKSGDNSSLNVKRKADNNDSSEQPSKKTKKQNKPDSSTETNCQENKNHKQESNDVTSSEQVEGIESNGVESFEWSSVLERIVSKKADGIPLEKLKKKLLKKYLSKLDSDNLSEKQQKSFDKKFKKYLKRSNFQINENLVKAC